MNGGNGNCVKNTTRKPQGKQPLETFVDGRILLVDLKGIGCEGVDWIAVVQVTVT
jgi:hypothetical protein